MADQLIFFKKIRCVHKNQAVNLQTNPIRVAISINKLFIVSALMFFSKTLDAQSVIAFYPQKVARFHTDSSRPQPATAFSLQKDNYVRNLAFFCRQEYKLEKALKIPFRFRVGSLEHCNLLEGKSKYQR